MAKYHAILTTAGAAKIVAATAGGTKLNLMKMAVGDGGGTLPVPNANQTKLINETYRTTLNKLSVDNKNKGYLIAEIVVPPEVGGFWMREMGLYDDSDTLVAVSNMAESYKPELSEGSGRVQTLRMVLMISNMSSVNLIIDSSTVIATQEYVTDILAEHERSRHHPDATLTDKGFTQLCSEVNNDSETLAATPKAVKMAMDNASARLAKERNGADIPDKTLFVHNIGVYSKAESDARYLQLPDNLPVGIPLPWPSDTPPTGWIICFGQSFDKTQYPQLASVYPAGHLPDTRGQTIKGKPDGREVLTTEQDGNKSHIHIATVTSTDLGRHQTNSFDYGTKSTNVGGRHVHGIPQGSRYGGSGIYASGDDETSTAFNWPPSQEAGDHSHSVYIGPHNHVIDIGPHSHSITINSDGNSETTVKNIAFNYIVRLA